MNARQHIGFSAGEHGGTAVIHQDQVELTFGRGRAAEQFHVSGGCTAAGAARMHTLQKPQIFERGNNLFQAHDRDLNGREGRGQAHIALVIEQRQGSRFSHGKVNTQHDESALQGRLAHASADDPAGRVGIEEDRHIEPGVQNTHNIINAQMRNAGVGMGGPLPGQLGHKLALIQGMQRETNALQRAGQPNLLRQERLCLHDLGCAWTLRQ